MTQPINPHMLADALTEEQSLDLFSVLREKYKWAGTIFTSDDVREEVALRANCSDGVETPEQTAKINEVTEQVLNSRYWLRNDFGARLSDVGYDVLADFIDTMNITF